MKGKQKRKIKQRKKRIEKIKQGKVVRFNLANSRVKYKGCKNIYGYQSNIHNLIYKDAKFENVRYQAANITYCNFKNTTLKGVDFISTNLKYTNFKGAKLKDVVFFNCKLKGVNFENVQFQNVVFISTKVDDAKNLELGQGCTCLKSYPKDEISDRLKDGIIKLAECDKLYNYHVLHVNKNRPNMWNISLLLQYGDENLARAMEALYRRKNKHAFYTIYAYKKFIESYLNT